MITLEQKSNNHEKEDNLTYLLAQLPEELRLTWRRKTDEFDIDEAIIAVREVLDKRKEAKEKIFTSISEIESPTLQEEVRRAVHTIEHAFGNAELFVGNGSVAEVYYLPEAPHVCVKYLINPNMAREHGNNFREESQHLNHMHGFIVDGVRVPNLLFYHTSDFGTCFGMEKINGKSINIITDNPHSIDPEYLETIKKQDMNTVLQNIKNFITRMHSEKKLVHRDLTARNIMVDREGNWYIIDFGRAKAIEIGDDSTDISEAADYPTAESAIRALFAKIN